MIAEKTKNGWFYTGNFSVMKGREIKKGEELLFDYGDLKEFGQF